MAKRSRQEGPPPSGEFVPPPYVSNVHRPGDKGTSDPFYQFKKAARDDGKPYKSPEPRTERQLLSLLGTNVAMVVMCGLLVVVVATLLVLLVLKV